MNISIIPALISTLSYADGADTYAPFYAYESSVVIIAESPSFIFQTRLLALWEETATPPVATGEEQKTMPPPAPPAAATEQADAAATKQADAADTEQADAADTEQADAADTEQADAADTEQADAADEEETVADDKKAPETDDKKAPEADDKKAPEADDKKAPEADDKKAPEADDKKVPEADDKKAPEADDKKEPEADDKKAPEADDKKVPEADDKKAPEAHDKKVPEADDKKAPEAVPATEQQSAPAKATAEAKPAGPAEEFTRSSGGWASWLASALAIGVAVSLLYCARRLQAGLAEGSTQQDETKAPEPPPTPTPAPAPVSVEEEISIAEHQIKEMEAASNTSTDENLKGLLLDRLEDIKLYYNSTEKWAKEAVGLIDEIGVMRNAYSGTNGEVLDTICSILKAQLQNRNCEILDSDTWDSSIQRAIKINRILPKGSAPRVATKYSSGIKVEGNLIRKQEIELEQEVVE